MITRVQYNENVRHYLNHDQRGWPTGITVQEALDSSIVKPKQIQCQRYSSDQYNTDDIVLPSRVILGHLQMEQEKT